MTMQNCPECNSANLTFFEKRNRYNCNECGANFEDVKQDKTLLRVFISYGRDEYASLAERLKADLAARGHEVWFDKERLKEGGDWEGYIDDGLNWVSRDAGIGRVVFIMTPHSVRRPDGYCLNEIAKALGRSIPIIPVMLVFCEPPLSIYRLQYLDMQECYPPDDKPGSYAKQLERLTLALEKHELDFEGIQSRLLKTLEPISFSADISKLLQDFTGRQWVFDAVDRWLHDPEGSKVFWLTGAPGVGKSAIAAWVRDNRREIGAFHFCDIHSEEKRNPSKLVRSIAYQLSTQLPAYEERLKNLQLEGIVQEYHEAYTLFDKLIVQPMADNFPPPDRTIVILIDALDEATYQKRNEISLFLSRCADKTPKWLRFLVTSRPEPEIRAALQSLAPYLLDTSTDENRADIIDYLRKKLPQITDPQIATLLEKSEGVFLYVRHVCEEVKPGGLSLDRLDQFPRGLGGIFLQFFARQFGSDINYYEQHICPVLCLILASFEPLKLGSLIQVLGYANRMELFHRLDRLGSLFPRTGSKDEDTIAPFHRSLSDWLTDKERSGCYYLDVEFGHRLLADYGWGEYLQRPEGMSGYSLEWLPSHLMEVGDFEQFVTVMRDFEYLMAKTKAGILERLLADFREILPQLPESNRIALWIDEAFFRERAHILRRSNEEWPAYKILLQLAIEHADNSPLTIVAEKFLAEGKCDWVWLRREKRPEHAYIDPCVAVFEGHTEQVVGAIELNDGRILSWSGDRLLRIWDKWGNPLIELVGHTHWIVGAQQLNDGRILSWSADNSLRLWDKNGKLLAIMEGHGRKVLGALELKNGFILSWSGGSIKIWNQDGAPFSLLEGHTDWVDKACELVDGTILTWSRDKTLRIWDITGTQLFIFEGHTERVSGALETSDGQILSWSDDNSVRLWDKKGNQLALLEGHSKWIRGAFELANGRILSWSGDDTLRIWDRDGNQLAILEECDTHFNNSAVELTCGYILLWSGDNTLRILDSDGMPQIVLMGHTNRVCDAIELSNKRILSWSNDKSLRIWDRVGTTQAVLIGHTNFINGALELKDGRILSWSKDNTLRLWDVNVKRQEVMEWHSGIVDGLIELLDGRTLTWSEDNTLRIWNSDGNLFAVMAGHTHCVRGAQQLGNGHIFSWAWDSNPRVWDGEGKLLAELIGHTDTVIGVSVLSNECILSWAYDELRLWNNSGKEISILAVEHNWVKGAIELRDGNVLSWWDYAPGGFQRGALRIWNWKKNLVTVMEGHTDDIKGALELKDGRILSWAADNTVRIWDRVGNQLSILKGHTLWVKGVKELQNGYILSWSGDNTLRLWEKDGGTLAVLDGHTDAIIGVLERTDGTILSWSFDNVILWDKDGSIIAGHALNDGLRLYPEARIGFCGKECVQGDSWIRDETGTPTLLCLKSSSQIIWHGESNSSCRLLKGNGKIVVTQANGQVCFLRIYYGNRQLSIEEMELNVAEKEGLELC